MRPGGQTPGAANGGAPLRGKRDLAKRAGWGMADQALSSLTNFALGIAVARSVSTAEFGAFSLAFATYLLLMGIVRAISAQPLVIRYATGADEDWRAATARSTGAALVVGSLAGAVCLVVGLVVGGAFGQAYVALGVTLPGLMVQDCWRFAFFAKGEGRAAFANDAVWALVLFPSLGVLLATDTMTVLFATLAWGGSATVAAVYGVRQSGAVPRAVATGSWWREHRDIVPSYLGEFGALAGGKQLALFGVGAVANLAVVGALRAGEILLGPIRTLFSGLRQVAQPEAVRLLQQGRNLVGACGLLSVALSLVALGVGAVILLLPDAVGIALLRDTWEPAQRVIFPLSLSMAGSGMLVGAQMGLHALVAVRRSLGSRVLLTVMLVTFEIVGAVLGGARGAAFGSAAAMWLGTALWWWQFMVAWRERRDDRTPHVRLGDQERR